MKRRGAGSKKASGMMKIIHRWGVSVLFVVVVVAAGIVTWTELRKTDQQDPSTNYLKSSNDIICSNINNGLNLQCQDVQTGELKVMSLPAAYESASITPHPDGTRLLVESQDGVVVTDTNFVEIRRVFRADELTDRYPSFVWGKSSSQLLIREVRREDNDMPELPAPVVIRMLDLETGENRRVFKTGETVDAESVKVLGADDDFVFVSVTTAKNWVARETTLPPDHILAVRLSDGLVRQVGSHQLDMTKDNQQLSNFRNIRYDGYKDLFVMIGDDYRDSAAQRFILAKLEKNEFGLVLRRVREPDVRVDGWGWPAFTSRGVVEQKSADGYTFPISVVDDRSGRTNLKLEVEDAYVQLFSLSAMPDLPLATPGAQN